MSTDGTSSDAPSPRLTSKDLAHVDNALEGIHISISQPDDEASNLPPAVFGAGGPMSVVSSCLQNSLPDHFSGL